MLKLFQLMIHNMNGDVKSGRVRYNNEVKNMNCKCGNDRFKIIDNARSIRIECSKCGNAQNFGKGLSMAEIVDFWFLKG